MKHTRFFLFLALGAMMMSFVACEDDNEVRPADPNSETLMADTLWVHPPFDTAAALEGRVWRCSEYTIESKSADPVQQLTASGYVLTTTLLDDSTFHTELLVNVDHYMVGFENNTDYRYAVLPISQLPDPIGFWLDEEWDTGLHTYPVGAPADEHYYAVRRLGDGSVQVKWAVGYGLEDEGITEFVFHQVRP